MLTDPSAPTSVPWTKRRQDPRGFWLAAEDGVQALEYLLVLAFGGIPLFTVILLFEDVLRETIEVTTLVVTSPFF